MLGSETTSHDDATPVDPPSGGRTRAIVQTRYGDTDTWSVASIDRPAIGDDEVLVEVRAAGLDRGTWHVMAGLPYLTRLVFGVRRPRNPVPGRDVAGVVTAVGGDVTRFAPGDEVFGIGHGSFAKVTAARESKLAHKPPGLTFPQAAAMGVSGLSALQALRQGRVGDGHHVLVVGASGGVGTFAVQIAKAQGATVTGVCSGAKADLVTSVGADHVVDYTRADVTAGGHRYDVIVDTGGNSPLRRLRRVLAPRGTLVIVGGEGGGRWLGGVDRQLRAVALSPFTRQRLTALASRETHDDLEQLAALAADGRIVPVVEQTYPLAEAAAAMRHLTGGRARGKLVVIP